MGRRRFIVILPSLLFAFVIYELKLNLPVDAGEISQLNPSMRLNPNPLSNYWDLTVGLSCGITRVRSAIITTLWLIKYSGSSSLVYPDIFTLKLSLTF